MRACASVSMGRVATVCVSAVKCSSDAADRLLPFMVGRACRGAVACLCDVVCMPPDADPRFFSLTSHWRRMRWLACWVVCGLSAHAQRVHLAQPYPKMARIDATELLQDEMVDANPFATFKLKKVTLASGTQWAL